MNTRSSNAEETAPGSERIPPHGAEQRARGLALETPPSRMPGAASGPFAPRGRVETGPGAAGLLERQLLLARSPGEDSIPRLSPPSWPRRAILAVVIAMVGAAGILFFVQVRGHWKSRASLLEVELEAARADAARRDDLHRREAAEKDRVIDERRVENRNLAGLAEKTFEELKTVLEDLRKARQHNEKLETELRTALQARAPSIRETLREWLSLAKSRPGREAVPDSQPSPPGSQHPGE
jgi:hypothetical protein